MFQDQRVDDSEEENVQGHEGCHFGTDDVVRRSVLVVALTGYPSPRGRLYYCTINVGFCFLFKTFKKTLLTERKYS